MKGTGDSVGPVPHEASSMGAGFEIARREQAHVGMIPVHILCSAWTSLLLARLSQHRQY
jgi:hypothetical protein